MLTRGVESSARSRKLAKYGITSNVKTYEKAYIETR